MHYMDEHIERLQSKLRRTSTMPYYWKMTQNFTEMGDESSLMTITYLNNLGPNPISDDDMNTLQNLDQEILRMDPNLLGIPGLWTLTERTGLSAHWITSSSDWIRIQLSDHCIYIIQLLSGQY